MTKMAVMLKNAQNLKKSSFPEHWANCFETWYVASLTVVLQNLYKTWPQVDLDLFYVKFNLSTLVIRMRKADIFFFLFLLYSRKWNWIICITYEC